MPDVNIRKLTRELFRIFPDFELVRNLAENIALGITTRGQAEELLWTRVRGSHQSREAIEEKLRDRKIRLQERWVPIRDLSFHEIVALEDRAFEEVLKFYLKHPYAHGRVSRPAFYKPRFFRTLFLRSLVGQAMKRKLALNFPEMLDWLNWL